MTPIMALFYLGLSVGTRAPVQAGTLPRPTLWAEPGSLVPWGKPVTLWCQGTSGAKKFHLYKPGSTLPWDMQLPLKPGDKAKFSVSYMTESDTGTYHCSYLSLTSRSDYSNPLELVVTGLDRKPYLSVSSSPVVASGETVTFKCSSDRGFNTFVLTQEGDPETHWKLDSKRLLSGQHQALFRIGPGPLRHRWSIRCYGFFSNIPQRWSDPSDPLQLLFLGEAHPGSFRFSDISGSWGLCSDGSPRYTARVKKHGSLEHRHRSLEDNHFKIEQILQGKSPVPAGTSRRPSLLNLQSLIVTPGQTLTLQCHSKDVYDTFALYKEKSQNIRQHPGHQSQARISQADFPLGPVSESHGGRYHCFGRHNFTSLWSETSNPIDILLAEQLSYTPSLSVEPGPMVSPGDNVTLLCQSRGWRDTFLLAKEGTADPPLHVKVDTTQAITQAQFSFHPVTSGNNGTYRCYSSNSNRPYRLSHPSAPQHLWVSGPSVDSRTMPTADVDPLLIGLSTAGALLGLLLLLFLLFFLRCRRQAGHRKLGTTHSAPQDTGLNTRCYPSAHVQKDSPEVIITHTQSEEGVRLNPQSKQDEDLHGATCTQTKHTGLSRGVASGTPLSGAQLNAQDQQTEENTQAGGQAEAPDTLLEVTYAQLKHLDTAQETTAPPVSLSGEPPEEPSVYAALAFH